jgi:rare lipoprotein A
MADGTPMDPEAMIAASTSWPLGSKVRVTNHDNGKSVVVEIRDRGPYVDGRIIDLSSKAARQLDIVEDGVATVTVTPLHIPEKN